MYIFNFVFNFDPELIPESPKKLKTCAPNSCFVFFSTTCFFFFISYKNACCTIIVPQKKKEVIGSLISPRWLYINLTQPVTGRKSRKCAYGSFNFSFSASSYLMWKMPHDHIHHQLVITFFMYLIIVNQSWKNTSVSTLPTLGLHLGILATFLIKYLHSYMVIAASCGIIKCHIVSRHNMMDWKMRYWVVILHTHIKDTHKPSHAIVPDSVGHPLCLVAIGHAVPGKACPSGSTVFPSQCHGSMRQNRHAFSNATTWFVSPSLRPHSKQSLRQTFHSKSRKGWAHSKPHVWRSSLAWEPCCPKNLLCLFMWAVQEPHLLKEIEKVAWQLQWMLYLNLYWLPNCLIACKGFYEIVCTWKRSWKSKSVLKIHLNRTQVFLSVLEVTTWTELFWRFHIFGEDFPRNGTDQSLELCIDWQWLFHLRT